MNETAKKSVLFLGKKGDQRSGEALAHLERLYDVESHFGAWSDALPESAAYWRGDLIVSYLGRWVLPQELLDRASFAALNFHPAPPEYPGIGCNNFALYDNSPTYGVTCHHMAAKVDTGEIISVDRFQMYEWDDVESLLNRTYHHLIEMFYGIMARIENGDPLQPSGEQWSRATGTRRALDALSSITPDMDAEEIGRRIRATKYGNWRPSVEIAGHKFVLADN